MLERILFDNYNIYSEGEMYIGSDMIVISEGKQYLVRPVEKNILTKLEEMKLMADWLSYHEENGIATILIGRNNRAFFKYDEKYFIVFQLPVEKHENATYEKFGKRLAQFHQKGFLFQRKNVKNNHSSSWKERWERRLDQLEKWYAIVTKKKNKSKIDESFCLSFPYFLSVSETAIQMIGDLFYDYGNTSFLQGETICHRRFRDDTWLTLQEGLVANIKIPTDFIFDHFVRDIADYIRSLWRKEGNGRKEHIANFLNEYETVFQLSPYDQKLLFIRLFFPLHYFETVERYYQARDEKEKAYYARICENIFSNTKDDIHLLYTVMLRFPQIEREMALPHWIK